MDYDNVENLYAVLGNEGPLMCFLGHTDVVANLNNWKIPPFKGVVKKGYLNGRGSQDMKGGIACFISAISNFIKNEEYNVLDDVKDSIIFENGRYRTKLPFKNGFMNSVINITNP